MQCLLHFSTFLYKTFLLSKSISYFCSYNFIYFYDFSAISDTIANALYSTETLERCPPNIRVIVNISFRPESPLDGHGRKVADRNFNCLPSMHLCRKIFIMESHSPHSINQLFSLWQSFQASSMYTLVN